MSTIIRDPSDQIWLYTKGAESHVLPLCRSSLAQDYLTKVTLSHIDEFATLGLRTLAVARRRLTTEEFSEFSRGKTCLLVDDQSHNNFGHFYRAQCCEQCISQSKDINRRSTSEIRKK